MRNLHAILEEFLRNVSTEDSIKVFRGLHNQKNVSEFKLAEDLRLNINTVRNILYSLHAHNLVYSVRKKDKEKGWYIYYWTFNMNYAKELLLKRKNERLKELKHILTEQETKNFFKCPDNHVRAKLEEAMEHDFKCVDCGKLLIEENKEKSIAEIKEEIGLIEKDITEIENFKIEVIEEEAKPNKAKKKAAKKKKIAKKKPKKKIKKKTPQPEKIVKKSKIKPKIKKEHSKGSILKKIKKKVKRLGF
ncbi:hypothetical protein HY500_02505 [Candidatus Woesearchaeota archaeon]|nr:hypothetical protein [Candidatus Woesearchaeota archaeon]